MAASARRATGRWESAWARTWAAALATVPLSLARRPSRAWGLPTKRKESRPEGDSRAVERSRPVPVDLRSQAEVAAASFSEAVLMAVAQKSARGFARPTSPFQARATFSRLSRVPRQVQGPTGLAQSPWASLLGCLILPPGRQSTGSKRRGPARIEGNHMAAPTAVPVVPSGSLSPQRFARSLRSRPGRQPAASSRRRATASGRKVP